MNKDAIQTAAKRLAIKMVYLENSEIKLYNDFDPLAPGQELIGQFRIGTKSSTLKETVQDDTTQRFIRFHVSAGMRYLKGPILSKLDENNISDFLASEITASFIAEYAIIGDEIISDECVKEFGKVNAPFNVWPYWREYCHSTCSRMALPVTVIPMLTIE